MIKMTSFQALSLAGNLLATLSPEMLSISISSLKEEGLLSLRDHTYKTVGDLLKKLAGMEGVMNRPYIKAVGDIAAFSASFNSNNLIAA